MGCLKLAYYENESPLKVVHRNFESNENSCVRGCRWGFNTQERTDEIAGVGNHTTAEYWEYDTRLGRRWNLDPIMFSGISLYSVNFNNPIDFSDPHGDVGGRWQSRKYEKQQQKDGWATSRKKNDDGTWTVTSTKSEVDFESSSNRTTNLTIKNFGYKSSGSLATDIRYATSDFIEGTFTDGMKNELNLQGDKQLNNTYAGAVAKSVVSANPLANLGFLATGTNVSGEQSDEQDQIEQLSSLIPASNVQAQMSSIIYKGMRYSNLYNKMLPYVGKTKNALKVRYNSLEMAIGKYKEVIQKKVNSDRLLRAIEQRVYEYMKAKGPLSNKNNPFNPNRSDYREYMKKAYKWLQDNFPDWKDHF